MHPQSSTQRLPQETEEWRPVVGYEGWYDVSNLGRVRRMRKGGCSHVGFILKAQINTSGYLGLDLSREDHRHYGQIHRLVAEAFLGPCPPGHEVNHKNAIKGDNRPNNLEWVTHIRNAHHAIELGLFVPPPGFCGEQCGASKLKEVDVRIIKAAKGRESQRSLAAHFGVAQPTISDIHRGKSWRHI